MIVILKQRACGRVFLYKVILQLKFLENVYLLFIVVPHLSRLQAVSRHGSSSRYGAAPRFGLRPIRAAIMGPSDLVVMNDLVHRSTSMPPY